MGERRAQTGRDSENLLNRCTTKTIYMPKTFRVCLSMCSFVGFFREKGSMHTYIRTRTHKRRILPLLILLLNCTRIHTWYHTSYLVVRIIRTTIRTTYIQTITDTRYQVLPYEHSYTMEELGNKVETDAVAFITYEHHAR